MSVTGTPLPHGIRSGIESFTLKMMMVATGIVLAGVAPRMLLLWMLLVYMYWRGENRNGTLPREREHRQIELRLAEQKWSAIQRRWRELSGEAQYARKLQELADAKHEYQHSDADFVRARQYIQEAIRTHDGQLQLFLTQFRIGPIELPISSAQLRILTTHGLRTAADINWPRLALIRRSVGGLTYQLMEWRHKKEAQFHFDATRTIQPADVQALAATYAQRRRELAAILAAGPHELQRIVTEGEQACRAFIPHANTAARRLAQAHADWSVVS